MGSRRNWSYFLLVASFSGIVLATLWPFQFTPPQNLSLLAILGDFHHASDIKDYWRNIILFIPWGVGLAGILARYKLSRSIIVIITLVASVGLSASVELIQSFLPTRISNLTDIATNTLGGGVGAGLYLWRQIFLPFAAALFQINGKKLTIKSLSVAFASYLALLMTAILVLLLSSNLNNWNDDFPLSIGNEATGNRPWQGQISSLYLSDQALADGSIATAFSNNRAFFTQQPNLAVSLTFNPDHQLQPNLDSQVPPLQWQGLAPASSEKSALLKNDPASTQTGQPGVFVNGDRWLQSTGSMRAINRRYRKSNEFTLSALVATDRLEQNGPARIFSISDGPFYRNLTLGQNGHYLSLRLRTPLTGDNANEPEFIIPNVFTDRNWHQILITFAHKTLNFYIDKPQNKYTFTFEPAVTFPTYYPMLTKNRFINPKDFSLLKYQIIFYALTLIPLGFLGGLLLALLRLTKHLNIWWIGGVCLVPALLIEQLSMTMSDRPLQLTNLLISTIILLGTTLVTITFSWRRLSKSYVSASD